LILGQAIGRWGNFFNSEAFGRPTDLPWKLYIPPNRRPPGYEGFEYFHPTFLYESLWNLMVFAILMVLFFRDRSGKMRLQTGTIFLVYLVAYSCGRFWIEGLRTDSLMLGSLRIAQVVSLVEIAIGMIGLAWLYLWHRPLPDVVPPQRRENSADVASSNKQP
jgi:phosphatidylglycerol:prolipoprotein diacylglycerol transferase